MKETFVRRLRGLEPVPELPPKVADVLAATGGVMVYEDDVMLAAEAMTGLSRGAADRFRKEIQKCHDDPQRLELSRRFLTACRENGYDLDFAKSMWVQMAKYNAYSFCRAHAASYAQLSYAGAFLKTHYPAEFWVAAMNNNQSMYPMRVYVDASRRDGVDILPPCVNRSGAEFALQGDAIRVGLQSIHGLGPGGVDRILIARDAGGPFEDLGTFLARTDHALGEPEVRALILCGATDAFGRTRPELIMELNLLRAMNRRRRIEMPSLLGGVSLNLPHAPDDFSPARKCADEWNLLGLGADGPRIARYRPHLAQLTDADSRDLPRRVGQTVRIAGMLEARRHVQTAGERNDRRGRTMAFLTLSDEFGLFEATIFPDALQRLRTRFDRYGPYLVTGAIQSEYDVVTLIAETVSLYPPGGTHAARAS